MSYEHPGLGGLDYQPCRYATARSLFRGPAKDLEEAQCLCFGSTETYGKFISRPYTELLERQTGLVTVNLGGLGTGVDAILSEPDLIAAANRATSVVVQISGAHMLSNRFYSVHPRRNDRFLKPSAILRSLYPNTDFTDFSFNGHLLATLKVDEPDIFDTVVAELRKAWTRRMGLLLDRLTSATVLLWMGDVAPAEAGDPLPDIRHPGGPLFVDRAMLDEITPKASHYVEVVASSDALATGTRGMTFADLDAPAAAALPGPRTHEEVADALTPVILQIQREAAPRPWDSP